MSAHAIKTLAEIRLTLVELWTVMDSKALNKRGKKVLEERARMLVTSAHNLTGIGIREELRDG